jgi:hypothetical protein
MNRPSREHDFLRHSLTLAGLQIRVWPAGSGQSRQDRTVQAQIGQPVKLCNTIVTH